MDPAPFKTPEITVVGTFPHVCCEIFKGSVNAGT
jgi:hypothetical protein